MREDGLFAPLRRAVPNPKAQEARENGWISADMWRLVNERVSVRRYPARYQYHILGLGCAIKANLKEEI